MLVTARRCHAVREGGDPCGATPLRERDHCFFHDPETQQEAAEARRLGGRRRRREGVVAGSFEFEGLASVSEIRRLVEVAVTDTFALENSVNRNRTLAYLAQTALKLLEAGELAERLDALEAAVLPRAMAR